MATTTSLNITITKVPFTTKAKRETPKSSLSTNYSVWKRDTRGLRMQVGPVVVRAAPESISEKVEESIKNAEEACSGDPESGECVAAWDEVEELSAAAGHARDKNKESSDPLESYCKDNPETDECRTYDN